jgi:hypothetical protein
MAFEKPLEDHAALVQAWGLDPILFARQVFSHWFPEEMPWFHRGMVALVLRRTDFLLNFKEETWANGTGRWTKKKLAKLVRCFTYPTDPSRIDSPRKPIFRVRFKEDGRTPCAIDMVINDHVNIIVPRGFSKTTVINFCNIYKTLYKLTKFTVYVSEAGPHAEAQLATIQRELSANEKIISVFGVLKPERSDDERWGAKSFETTTGVKFAARGRSAQIRGLNLFSDRPDTIVLDDVEDKESVATDIQREKTLSWFISDVMEAFGRGKNGHCYAVGTILHPKALLPTLARGRMFTTVQLGAIDPEGEALWDSPYGLTLKKIEAKRQEFARVGKLYEFGLEILSTVRNEEKQKFKKEYIRYETCKRTDFVAVSIHIDPAISNKPGADYCCIAVVGQKENGQKHVLDFHAERGMPFSKQAEKYFELKMRWDCTHHSSESTAYQAALAQVIRELMFIKAKVYGTKAYFQITEVWPSGRKTERVEGILQPLMAAGYLTFQQIWPELEVMFLEWPDEKLDGPDAIAGAVANLEPYAPLSYGDGEGLAASEGEPMEYDAPCQAGRSTVP